VPGWFVRWQEAAANDPEETRRWFPEFVRTGLQAFPDAWRELTKLGPARGLERKRGQPPPAPGTSRGERCAKAAADGLDWPAVVARVLEQEADEITKLKRQLDGYGLSTKDRRKMKARLARLEKAARGGTLTPTSAQTLAKHAWDTGKVPKKQ